MLGKRLDRDGWSQIVVNMIQRGAQGSDDEFADIVDYLTNTVFFGRNARRSNVNKTNVQATFETGLDLSDKEAEAIFALPGREGRGSRQLRI